MGKEQETEQQTVASVPNYITEAGQNLLTQSQELADKPFESYTGERVAGFSGDQQTAFQELRNLVSNRPNVVGEALDGARSYGSAPAQEISTERVVDEGGRLGAISDYFNPYDDNALQPAIRKIMEAADAQRKRISAGATSAGAFGDARHGILERDLDFETSSAIGETSAQFFKDAFDRAMGHRQTDLSRFNATDQNNASFDEAALNRQLTGSTSLLDMSGKDQTTALQAIQALLTSGGVQQGNEQAGLDADYGEFLREYGHEFSILDALGAALSGVPYERTQTTTQTTPDNSGYQAAGAAAGAILPKLIAAI